MLWIGVSRCSFTGSSNLFKSFINIDASRSHLLDSARCGALHFRKLYLLHQLKQTNVTGLNISFKCMKMLPNIGNCSKEDPRKNVDSFIIAL